MAAFAAEGDGRPVLKCKLHGFCLLDPPHQWLRSADRTLRNQGAGFGADGQGIGNQRDIAPVDDEHAIAAEFVGDVATNIHTFPPFSKKARSRGLVPHDAHKLRTTMPMRARMKRECNSETRFPGGWPVVAVIATDLFGAAWRGWSSAIGAEYGARTKVVHAIGAIALTLSRSSSLSSAAPAGSHRLRRRAAVSCSAVRFKRQDIRPRPRILDGP